MNSNEYLDFIPLNIGTFNNSKEMKNLFFTSSTITNRFMEDIEKGGALNSFSSSDSGSTTIEKDPVIESVESVESITSSDSEENNPDKVESLTNNEDNNLTQQYQNNMVATNIRKILGNSILDLRHTHELTQRRRASQNKKYDSDSDSDSTLEDSIRKIAETDTTWFQGCGFRMTLDTSIFFSQVLIALIALIFCIIKLSTSNSCDVTQIYAPIMTAILAYFFASPIKDLFKKNKKK